MTVDEVISLQTDKLDEVRERVREKSRALPSPRQRKAIRVLAGWTQTDVGEVLGVRHSEVSRWESGDRVPGPSLRAAYAELLERLRDGV